MLCPILTKAQSFNAFGIDSATTTKYSEAAIEPAFEPKIEKNSFFKRNSNIIVPTAMFGFGVIALDNPALKNFDYSIRERVLAQPNRSTNHQIEDVMQYVPMYSVFALNMVGLKSNHKLIDRIALYALSNTLMSHTVAKMKTRFGKLRPDGSNNRSFPSGHTATAFSAAEFMRLEYKGQSPIYGIAAYAIAATTGGLRIYHNNHWFSDVVAGAGIGILSTQVSYFVYPRVKNLINKGLGLKKTSGLSVGPSYKDGAAGFALVYNP